MYFLNALFRINVLNFNRILVSSFILIAFSAMASNGLAVTITLAWDPPSQGSDLTYTLCYGKSSNTYTTCIDTGYQTSTTLENIEPGVSYYYAATASNQYGESEFSQEIEHTIPLSTNDSDDDGDGITEAQGDCNDSNSGIHPNAVEVCGDGVDQNCDGSDPLCPGDTDNDNDGFTENQGDCNDSNPGIHPGALEVCNDSVDQNCDGSDLVCPNDNDGVGISNPLEIDDGDFGTFSTGNWSQSSQPEHYGIQSLYSRSPGATYNFEAPMTGVMDVMLWWTDSSSRCSQVPVRIYDGPELLQTVRVNQQANGGRWNYVERFVFNGEARVEIVAENSWCSTAADAAKFVPVP